MAKFYSNLINILLLLLYSYSYPVQFWTATYCNQSNQRQFFWREKVPTTFPIWAGSRWIHIRISLFQVTARPPTRDNSHSFIQKRKKKKGSKTNNVATKRKNIKNQKNNVVPQYKKNITIEVHHASSIRADGGVRALSQASTWHWCGFSLVVARFNTTTSSFHVKLISRWRKRISSSGNFTFVVRYLLLHRDSLEKFEACTRKTVVG